MLPLAGGDLDGVKLDADLSFPARIKQALNNWRAGLPGHHHRRSRCLKSSREPTRRGSRVKLFFDKESGLLVRLVRYTSTVVGVIPTEIDYSDYREVAGVKMPFHWIVTWTDGQSTIELSEVQPTSRLTRRSSANRLRRPRQHL